MVVSRQLTPSRSISCHATLSLQILSPDPSSNIRIETNEVARAFQKIHKSSKNCKWPSSPPVSNTYPRFANINIKSPHSPFHSLSQQPVAAPQRKQLPLWKPALKGLTLLPCELFTQIFEYLLNIF